MDEFLLLDQEVSLLGTLDPACKEIEDVFSISDKKLLGGLMGKQGAGKKDILLLVQEHLASQKKLPIEEATLKRMRKILTDIDGFSR